MLQQGGNNNPDHSKMQNTTVLPWNNEIHNMFIEPRVGFTAMRLQLSFEDKISQSHIPEAWSWALTTVKNSRGLHLKERASVMKHNISEPSAGWMLWSEHRLMWSVGYMKYQVQEKEQNVQTCRKAVTELCLVCTATQLITHSVIQWNCVKLYRNIKQFIRFVSLCILTHTFKCFNELPLV